MVFTKALTIAFLSTFCFAAFAENFCQNLDGIHQIKSYVLCQNNPGIASCAGLATGLGARLLLKSVKNQYERAIVAAEEQTLIDYGKIAFEGEKGRYRIKISNEFSQGSSITDAPENIKFLEDEIRAAERRGITDRQTDVFRITLKRLKDGVRLGGRPDDIILEPMTIADKLHAYEVFPEKPFSEQSPEVQKILRDKYRDNIGYISKTLSNGRKFDEAFIKDFARFLYENDWESSKWAGATKYEDLVRIANSDLSASARGNQIANRTQTKVVSSWLGKFEVRVPNKQEAVETLQEFETLARTYGTAFERNLLKKEAPTAIKFAALLAGQMSLNLEKKAPLVAGGAISLGLFVALEIVFTPKYGDCGDAPAAQYINANPEERCAPQYEINEAVLRLLNSNDETIKESLTSIKVCDFYRELHKKIFTQPKFVSLTCHNQNFKLDTRTPTGETIHNTVAYWPGTKDIRQVTLAKSSVSTIGTILVKKDGTIDDSGTSSVWKMALPLKLYIEDARACCATKDDKEHLECLAKYNPVMGAHTFSNGAH